jgi:hypothetical protein
MAAVANAVIVCGGFALWSQTAARKPLPVIGKSPRYCNPLPLEASSKDGTPQGVSLGDVTVVREGDDYYLFGTGGGAWMSTDFLHWKYQPVEVRGGRLPVAPHVVKYHGSCYMSGNNRPGRDAAYAVDGTNGAWWEPAENDAQPTLTVDLGSITEFEDPQYFAVDSSRIEFATGGRAGFGPSAAAAPAGQTTAFRYKIEASKDGKTYQTILDKTNNAVTRYTEFDELFPTVCRFVRLTITDWPHLAGAPLGVLEFTVFGNAVASAKAAAAEAKK